MDKRYFESVIAELKALIELDAIQKTISETIVKETVRGSFDDVIADPRKYVIVLNWSSISPISD